MNNGWIKLHRKTIDSQVWELYPLAYRVWSWLLMSVDHQTGEIITSLGAIAQGVSWWENGQEKTPNRKVIRDILNTLTKLEMTGNSPVTPTGNTSRTKISICNWSTYQYTNNNTSNSPVTPTGNSDYSYNVPVPLPSTPPKQEIQEIILPIGFNEKNQEERVKFIQELPTPMLRTEAELLAFLPGYDHATVYQHYLKMKKRFGRIRFLDSQVDRALSVLARDPDIDPRLTQEEMMGLVGLWMQWGKPWHAADLWKFTNSPKYSGIWWEILNNYANHRANFSMSPNPDDDLNLDQWIKKEEQNAKSKRNSPNASTDPKAPGGLLPLLRPDVGLSPEGL